MKVQATKTSAVAAGLWTSFGMMFAERFGWNDPSSGLTGVGVILMCFLVPVVFWVIGVDDLKRPGQWARERRSGEHCTGGSILSNRRYLGSRGWPFTKEAWQRYPVVWLRMILWFLAVGLTLPFFSYLLVGRWPV